MREPVLRSWCVPFLPYQPSLPANLFCPADAQHSGGWMIEVVRNTENGLRARAEFGEALECRGEERGGGARLPLTRVAAPALL